MESQKYIGVFDSSSFEIEESFVRKLSEFDADQRQQLLKDILTSIYQLPTSGGWTYMTAGVIRSAEPLFYVIEYVNEEEDVPLLLDIFKISSDDYLDYVLEYNTIEYYAERNQDGI